MPVSAFDNMAAACTTDIRNHDPEMYAIKIQFLRNIQNGELPTIVARLLELPSAVEPVLLENNERMLLHRELAMLEDEDEYF